MKKTFVIAPETDQERTVCVELLDAKNGGRQYRVSLSAPGEESPSRTFELDAASFREGVYSLITEDRRSLEVSVGRDTRGHILAEVNSHVYTLDVLDERAMRKLRLSGGNSKATGPELVSPMAGKIIQVGVGVGDIVEEGQPVVIVEAMKMENDLKAHHAGTVTAVEVAAGDTVDVGQVLLKIEAAEEA